MTDWSKFIIAGFTNEKEKLAADKELDKYGPTLQAKENELEVTWYTKDRLRYYTVVCRCGNNRMLYHENGVRCHICGRFHSHDNFNKHRLQAQKLAKQNDGETKVKPKPMYETVGIQRSRSRTSKSNTVFGRDGLTGMGASTGKPNAS